MRRSQISKSVATKGWLWHREFGIGIQGNMHTTSNLRYNIDTYSYRGFSSFFVESELILLGVTHLVGNSL